MIVSCANCGKRFKGSPGPRKFKCSGCGNLFTFPETAMAPAPEHVLCSNCWSEMKANPDLKGCPMCSQKLAPNHGGRAVEESAPPPQQEQDQQQEQQRLEQERLAQEQERLEQQLAQQQQELQQQLIGGQQDVPQQEQDVQLEQDVQIEQDVQLDQQLPSGEQEEQQVIVPPPSGDSTGSPDGDAYRVRAELAEAQVKELEDQLNAFREAAIGALEPLVPEVNRLMQALSDEVAQIQTLVSQARQHLQVTAPPAERMMGLSDLQKLETTASEMQGRVEAIRSTLTTRLQEVLGEPEDAPAQQG